MKPRCHYDHDAGWLTPEHARDCADHDCDGCRPCPKTHCAMRGKCASHVEPETGERTCPACIGKVRGHLNAIELLASLNLPDEAEETGVESEAFNLTGPAADPGQWEARRQRMVAGDDGRGWCQWPRHEALDPLDPRHPYTVLGGWDMALRETYGPPTDLLVSVSRAADYLRGLLAGPFPHGEEFEAFDAALADCRAHLEAVIHDSREPEKGAPCPTCAAEHGKGPRLRKRYAAHPGLKPGEVCAKKQRGEECPTCDGEADTWHCPDVASHWFTDHEYRNRIGREHVRHASELTDRDCEARTGVKAATIRKWAERGHVRRRLSGGRRVYVVADVVRHAEGAGALRGDEMRYGVTEGAGEV